MMAYPPVASYFRIGQALKSHGTGGQLRLLVEDRLKGYIHPGTYVFFDLNGSKVPYLVNEVDDHQHFVVRLVDVEAKQLSDLLAGKELWIPSDQIKERHRNSPRHVNEKWDDYAIEDEFTGVIYPILRTEEFPQQLIAVIEVEGREVMVPLHDQLISDIDKVEKRIRMQIPEGLLDL